MNGIKVTAAAIQMVSTNNIEQNLEQAQALLNIAVVEHNANLIVFPENFLCFGVSNQHILANKLSIILQDFQGTAAKLKVNLVLGSLPSYVRQNGQATDGRFCSASYVVNDSGVICTQYDKIHLFDVDVEDKQGSYRESDEFEAGEAIKVVDVTGCRLGLSICYDLRFPDLFQQLRQQGANVIALPAAFTKTTGQAHWELLLRARAIETQSYIIAANQGGKHSAQRETWGHSMIISPWGEIIAEQKEGVGVCSTQLDFEYLNAIRKAMPIEFSTY